MNRYIHKTGFERYINFFFLTFFSVPFLLYSLSFSLIKYSLTTKLRVNEIIFYIMIDVNDRRD